MHGAAGDDVTAEPCPRGCGSTVTFCRCAPPTEEEAQATLLAAFPDATVTELPTHLNR